ncbi:MULTISPECIES: class II aldolase/adducin family protein [Streptomyces]|uniref:Class II aldolase/adducin family protein n=1 Tax=Streptomyces morookaense TaxID=1970 RepID=A0A7Y7E6C9_STRMO|nr:MULTISPECIES: class II aldolase/adducin family protein [Streptomyces]MCC2278267.1 class II aldolase/adducin family protein [Streptomyces sp. ET3-23]NVK77793.1 class II aldolase/adducin family protein [Streptomyces morookaense]GHF19962.1 class II aldolase/adducin family protein [Streptomyces morookaense]
MPRPTDGSFAASLRPRDPKLPGPPEFATVEEERRHRREQLAIAFRIFGKFGYGEHLAGHITVRDPELLDHFWVNPLGRSFSRIRVSDLILVNAEGLVVHGDAPVNKAAFAIHSQLHHARPDIVAAAHSHSLHGKALAALGQPLLPITQDACLFFEDNVVVPDFQGIVYDPAEGARIAKQLGSMSTAILANHGLLTVGRSVEEAATLYVQAERAAQVQLIAAAAGELRPIDPEVARFTYNQTGLQGQNWRGFLPLREEILHEQPDVLH